MLKLDLNDNIYGSKCQKSIIFISVMSQSFWLLILSGHLDSCLSMLAIFNQKRSWILSRSFHYLFTVLLIVLISVNKNGQVEYTYEENALWAGMLQMFSNTLMIIVLGVH